MKNKRSSCLCSPPLGKVLQTLVAQHVHKFGQTMVSEYCQRVAREQSAPCRGQVKPPLFLLLSHIFQFCIPPPNQHFATNILCHVSKRKPCESQIQRFHLPLTLLFHLVWLSNCNENLFDFIPNIVSLINSGVN